MKKSKIFIYHLLVFIAGSIGIVVYVFTRLSKAGLGGAIVLPVVALVYVVGFGILCAISFAIWTLIVHFRDRRRLKQTPK